MQTGYHGNAVAKSCPHGAEVCTASFNISVYKGRVGGRVAFLSIMLRKDMSASKPATEARGQRIIEPGGGASA